MTAGRPTILTDEIIEKILVKSAEGKPLTTICKPKNMPSRTTVGRWLKENKQFRGKYEESKREMAEVFADEIAEIADNKDGEVQRDRLRIDTRKWLMSKLIPKKYGDRQEVEHSGTVSIAEQIIAAHNKK